MSKHKKTFTDYQVGDFVEVDGEFTGTITYIYDDNMADVEFPFNDQDIALPFCFNRLTLIKRNDSSSEI